MSLLCIYCVLAASSMMNKCVRWGIFVAAFFLERDILQLTALIPGSLHPLIALWLVKSE